MRDALASENSGNEGLGDNEAVRYATQTDKFRCRKTQIRLKLEQNESQRLRRRRKKYETILWKQYSGRKA